PPANDNFANRQQLSGANLLLDFDNLGATLEPGEPTSVEPAAGTVWFTWTAPMTGRVQFSLPGHDFAAFVAVYAGNALTNLNLVSVFDSDTPSSFAAVEGVSYQIAVGGYSDSIATGHATLQWEQFSGFTNDDFANATVITGSSFLTSADNVAATLEPGEPTADGNASGHSVWWRWTAPDNGTVLISTGSGSGEVGVYVGNTVSNLTTIGGNEFAGDNYHTVLSFDAAAGVTYSIAVDGTYGNSG